MTSKKEINAELEYLVNLKEILETYEEIAASRMARIRSSVLRSRDFLFEINSIFQEVKSSYKSEVELLMRKKRIKDLKQLTFLNRNGKTLYVLISANTGLYGEIIRKTYNVFLENIKKEKCEVAIIGKLGFQLFQAEKINAPFTYFDFPDDKIDREGLKKIIAHILKYQKVLVFYQQFNNLVSQIPIISNISGDSMSYDKPEPQIKYFFEPSLEKIMAFFEKEIVASIFEQTMMESEFAKFASRMIALNAATDNTNTQVKKTIFTKEKIRHQDMNKQQLEMFSSRLLWK